MGTQTLSLPLDITWQRLAYSRDMMDTSFGDLEFPPKWRSSMTVYAYQVPAAQTIETYPDGRIVYLRLSCSITGWNPSEDLAAPTAVEGSGDAPDDLQTSLWEVIQSEGWANTYWPCLGAIAQIAVYPGEPDGEVTPDDFPYIVDFEPKKRELYKTRSETGEFISGSSGKVSVQKGVTTTKATEESDIFTGASASASFLGFGGSAGISGEWGTREKTGREAVEITNTDASRERRETTSFSTTINQMYQLFTGYHLGMNRAVFYIEPRPHIVNQTQQTNSNIIKGQRRLEGLQDVFLVVHVPKSLAGICVQATLDTTHRAMFRDGVAYAMKIKDGVPPPPPGGDDDGGFHVPLDGLVLQPNWPEDAGSLDVYRLVMTRRVIRNCARFDAESARLIPVGDSAPQPTPATMARELAPVVFETVLPGPTQALEGSLLRTRGGTQQQQFALADQMNRFQHDVTSAMLSGFSAGRYKPRPFIRTDTFRTLAIASLRNVRLELDKLGARRHLSRNDIQSFHRAGLRTVADLFRREAEESRDVDPQRLAAARARVIEAVLAGRRRR